ncbi:MAG: IS110 family transposase [Mesorhizobium sp.]
MQGKVLSEPNAMSAVYAGIDVCKEWLDVYVHPSGLKLRVANDGHGLRRLKRVLRDLKVARVIMEATAKYHRAAQRSLHAAGLCVCIVDPLRARLFAKACGQLAKTDAIDARLLALMGEALDPEETPPPSQALEELQELVNARAAATVERTALANRRQAVTTAFLRAELRRRLSACERHVERLDVEIERCIMADAGFARRHAILISIPGIGAVTAAALIGGLAELGTCTGKQAAMLAGLAPVACDSGERNRPRAIRGGRSGPRNAAYMASLSASRHNPDLAVFAKRLRSAGKPAKVILVAVMRKLIVLANTLIAQNRLWSPIAP